MIAGTLLVAITVVIHCTAIGLGIRWLRRARLTGRSFWGQTVVLASLAMWCVVAHLTEMTIWAVFYVLAGVMPDLEVAGYFSATTYATIGYGDVTPPTNWRLLTSIEGLVGILMCAWSAGFTFAIVSGLMPARVADR